ncbi:SET and MYND domain protein [Aspergillus heteromorphus CBS 117.55]|uniref:SET and MYND domain protein n=1 Tax=Aspergillus heteromorphus CBS 117.55 TaxID=1448321 RepID=A0A317VKL5_9EURO|nr:SET and MYND domain protein [Aspergillus heteromorphus CBS 117.55]PWY73707.1 SET and MYND domain protein [Aspergillus heteromorphus CBS 117.55]
MSSKTTPAPASDGLGRGLFASTDLAIGETVLHISTPFVAVLDKPRLEDTCSGCLGKRHLGSYENTLKACRGCHVVKYCDKTCQSKDWKFAHSLECGIYQQLQPRILPINARAVLRMVLRNGRKKYGTEEMKLFLELETHIKDIRDENEAQWQRIALCSKAVKTYAGTEMQEEFISAFGAKLDLNSFNLTNAVYDRIGVYLHPYAALINHSCTANAVVGFEGDELYVKALRPIAKGDQIFISYVDATNPYSVRRTELRGRYYFDCRCERCQTESSSAPTSSETAATTNNHHPHHRPIPPPAHFPPTPITTQPSVSLRDELIVSLLTQGKFKTAFAHATIRYTRIDPVVYAPHHPIRQLHAWSLSKLAILLSQGVDVSHRSSSDDDEEEVALEKFEVNLGLIIWAVLGELVAGEERACTVPGFKGLVREAFGQVHGEFLAGGLDPRAMGAEVKREWGKVGRLVDEVLEREG